MAAKDFSIHARHGRELGEQRRRADVDVQDAHGHEVERRRADDGRGRRSTRSTAPTRRSGSTTPAITGNLTAEIPDRHTVVITTSVPDPRLPALDFYIMPKHIYEKISAEDLPNHAAEDNDRRRAVHDRRGQGGRVRPPRAQPELVRQEAGDGRGDLPLSSPTPKRSLQRCRPARSMRSTMCREQSYAQHRREGDNIIGDRRQPGRLQRAVDELRLLDGARRRPCRADRPAGAPGDQLRRSIATCWSRSHQRPRHAGDRDRRRRPTPSWDLKLPPRASSTRTTPTRPRSCWTRPAGPTTTATAHARRTASSCSCATSIAASGDGRANTEFITGWLNDVGIATEVDDDGRRHA